MRFEIKLLFWMFFASLLTAPLAGAVFAEDPAKPVAYSADQRFGDLGDGTILDKETGLIWMARDYWQTEKKMDQLVHRERIRPAGEQQEIRRSRGLAAADAGRGQNPLRPAQAQRR